MPVLRPEQTEVSAILTVGKTKLLNVPFAAAAISEIWDEDCYRLASIPDGSIVIDVGAFYGEFGLICAVEKRCRVLAIEPNQESYLICHANCEINPGLKSFGVSSSQDWGSIVATCCAISKTAGAGQLFIQHKHPAGCSLYPHDGCGRSETVTCRTMASEIERAQSLFGYQHPVCVKLDCEGAEREIFEDLDWLKTVHIVTLEWHNRDGHLYAAMLDELGFHVEIEGGGPKPRPPWDASLGGGLLFAKRK